MKVRSDLVSEWNEDEYPPEPCTEEEIDVIKRVVHKPLPVDYVEFLRNYGCVGFKLARDSLDSVVAKYRLGENTKEIVRRIEYLMNCRDIVDSYKILSGDSPHFDAGPRIPSDMLPIAANGNDVFLLDLSDKNYGTIWYWEGIEETWGSEENNMLGYAARSFTDFLNALDMQENVEQGIVDRGGEPTYR